MGFYVVRLDDGYSRFFIFSLIFFCDLTHIILTFNFYLIHSERIIKTIIGNFTYYIHVTYIGSPFIL